MKHCWLASGLLLASLTLGGAAEGTIIPSSWSVVGPYPSDAANDLDRPFPPETERDFGRELRGSGPDEWLYWSGPPSGNDLHLLAPRQHEAPAIAYAVTYIDVPAASHARVAITSAVPYRAWLDGTPIAGDAAVELVAGVHELLVKQRVGGSSDSLSVTYDGSPSLRFLPQRPWPMRPMPTTMWREVRLADPTIVRDLLARSGGLGFPDLANCVWTVPATEGEALRCAGDGTLFLVGHIFLPLKYHQQEYRVGLRGLRPAVVLLDGQRMDLAVDGADAVTFRVASHKLQAGFNRMVIELPVNAAGSLLAEISDPGDLKFAAEVPAHLNPTLPVGDWPSASISNGLVTARLALPDDQRGLYRGNRFERAGIIAQLAYRGHTYFLGTPEGHRPLDNGVCYGPAEEWFHALAWRDARVGEPFLKMGVGLYERPAHPLHMWYCAYWPQAILPWTTRIADGTAEFTQVCDGPRGWGYRYIKRLVLEPDRPVLRIEHELTNTGRHIIDGEQYNHNFISLDGLAPQAGYRCDFTYAPKPAVDISRLARIDGRSLILTAGTVQPFGFDLTGWSNPLAAQGMSVSCAGTSAQLLISGSAPLAKLFFFCAPDYLSLEPFIRVVVAPGATTSWTRTYTFVAE